MTGRRVRLPPERIQAGRAALTAEARHYLVEVLRLAPGAEVEVFDGRGGRWPGRLDADRAALALGPRADASAAALDLALVLALAKGEKVDLVVQKATELGVTRIVPFAAERSVVRLDAGKGEERAARWRRIAGEAARQCGRADVPEVDAPRALDAALLALAPGTLALVFHPGGARLADLAAEALAGAPLAAVVGPEGGLTDGEVALCEARGARRASLGPRILRAETAAIVAVALMQARFGDLS